VGLLIASGFYSIGRQVTSLDAMLTTLYGRALIVKVALVLCVGAFGLPNSSMLHPRLSAPLARLPRRPSGWTPLSLKRLPALVIAESTLGLLVLLATGVMLASPPAHGPQIHAGLTNARSVGPSAETGLLFGVAGPPGAESCSPQR
jgi:putative copper export protein